MSAQHAPTRLRARGLECVRGEKRVFTGLAFDLASGGLLQVSGFNGSGKTSLLRMVCGLLQPVAGVIEWDGSDVRTLGEDYRADLAYVGHSNAVKDELDARENLRLGAQLARLPADEESISAALARFGFDGFEHLPCKFLSQGQKRRLALARLRLSEARVLWVLDEPFAALDASGIALMRVLLEEHLGRGGLGLLTTHQVVDITAPGMQRVELKG